MLIIPAIDIKNGKCVRLIQGDPDRETIYSNDPVAMARHFESAGARLIHVVDLDGAFEGHPVNQDTVLEIAANISIPIEIGGGIRNAESLEKYIESGIRRVILGTVVLEDEFSQLVSRYRESIIVGIDAKDSMVATHGWKKVSSVHAVDFIKELQKKGITEIIFTDISTDGMLTGPNYASLENILNEVEGVSLIASGGVSSIEDITRLSKISRPGLKGCIVGKAIYDGRIDLHAALELFQ